MTEIKPPTCRTVRAERPVCPKVVGAEGGGGGGGEGLLTGVQSKDDCGGIVICHQMSSTD